MRKVKTSFKVNGKPVELELEPRRLLVSVLREDLGLTGTHQCLRHDELWCMHSLGGW